MNVVLTGCNRGIGKSILEELSEKHHNVWAVIRQPNSEFEELCKFFMQEYGIWIKILYCDFSDEESVKKTSGKIIADKNAVNGLVNNVGIIGKPASFLMTSINDIRNQFDINFFNPMNFTRQLVGKMKESGYACIVNMASISGIDGYGIQLGYAASKAAVIGATRSLARELADSNIRVNAVAPGIIDTDMSKSMTAEQRADVETLIWQRKCGNGKDVSKLVLFLLSNDSNYITGQTFRIDGGM